MALPVILVDSTSGSDSAASGAGPSTAVTGSNARTRSAAVTKIGLFEGSAPDLSGVNTDGSHALFVANTTAGRRCFSSITSKSNTAYSTTGNITSGAAILSALGSTTGWAVGDPIRVTGAGAAAADLYSSILTVDSSTQVTLNDNAGTTVTGNAVLVPKWVGAPTGEEMNTGGSGFSWAIGGKRASIAGTQSAKLFENNAAAGDSMGWTIQLASAHSEPTISATITFRRPPTYGSSGIGATILQGESVSSRPIITFSNNGVGFTTSGSEAILKNLDIRNSNATKTASVAISGAAQVWNCVIGAGSNTFWKGMSLGGIISLIGNTIYGANNGSTSLGIELTTSSYTPFVFGNFVTGYSNSSSSGINFNNASGTSGGVIQGNIVENCGTGILIAAGNSDSGVAVWGGSIVSHNTVYSCGDGIRFSSTGNAINVRHSRCFNNLVTNCTGYGIRYDLSTDIDTLERQGIWCFNNNTKDNTSGDTPTAGGRDNPSLTPSYTNAASDDFSIATNLKGKGYPEGGALYVGRNSATYSYVDIGAAQRQEPAGAGTTGGFVIGG